MSRSEARRVLVTGALAPHVGGFCDELERRGYADASAVDQVRLMACLSRWLADGGLDLEHLTSERVEQFLAARRERYVRLISLRALAPLLGYLRALELIPDARRSRTETPLERLLEDYRGYLVVERRGLTAMPLRAFAAAVALGALPKSIAYVALSAPFSTRGLLAIALYMATALAGTSLARRHVHAARAARPATGGARPA